MPPATLEPAATLHLATHDHILATWSNVVILVWRHETTLAGVHAGQQVLADHTRAHPNGVFLMTIVEFGAPMPTPEVRDALATLLASGANRILLSAVAHEGTGFRAAAVRSVVTGLAVLAKLPYPHKVFATVDEASAWFSGNSPIARMWGERAKALADAVVEVRYRGEQSAP
ncbi:MAG: hypothetical protein ABI461_19620 [Polyangiaceae bacterium]